MIAFILVLVVIFAAISWWGWQLYRSWSRIGDIEVFEEPPPPPLGRVHTGHHFRMRHPDRLRMEHHRGTER